MPAEQKKRNDELREKNRLKEHSLLYVAAAVLKAGLYTLYLRL